MRVAITRRFAYVVICVCLTLAFATQSSAEGVYADGYFGAPVATLSNAEKQSFERGFGLFVRRWDIVEGKARNARSCVTCHSVPVAGGSGMSVDAIVDVTFRKGRTEVLQRHPDSKQRLYEGKFYRAHRRTPPLFGLGLIEHAGERVRQGVERPVFGAFAEERSLLAVIARAFAAELGLSSSRACARAAPDETYPLSCPADVSDSELEDVASFIRFLAAPPKRRQSDSSGLLIFRLVGCAKCHSQHIHTLKTAPRPLAGRRVEAFTDLQTHDVGVARKVRTAPLWGLNSHGPPYLHDGRAKSIEDAIVKHAGSANNAVDAYKQLSTRDRDDLLQFLRSL